MNHLGGKSKISKTGFLLLHKREKIVKDKVEDPDINKIAEVTQAKEGRLILRVIANHRHQSMCAQVTCTGPVKTRLSLHQRSE